MSNPNLGHRPPDPDPQGPLGPGPGEPPSGVPETGSAPAYGAYGQQPGRSAYGAPGTGSQQPGQPAYGAYGQQPGQPAYGAYGQQPGQPAYGAYGQQPGQPAYGAHGQQPGQPAYGAPSTGGQSPYYGGNPASPAPEPSSKGGLVKWVIVGALVVILVSAAVWVLTQRAGLGTGQQQPGTSSTGGTDISALVVGQCMQFVEMPGAVSDPVGKGIPVSHRVVDCEQAGEFKLVVASVTPGNAICPNGDYVQYYQSDGSGSGNRMTVCLAPVLEVGHCYAPDNIREWVDTACDDPASYLEVDSTLDGTDASACPTPEDSFIFPEPSPGRVYCLVAPH